MNVAERASIAPKDRRVSFAPAPITPRICSVCGCPDCVLNAEGEHRVTIELRYLKSRGEFTPYLEARGWRYRKHQARDAMERFICRRCLIATREMSHEFKRKREKELGAKNFDPYYLAVCGE